MSKIEREVSCNPSPQGQAADAAALGILTAPPRLGILTPPTALPVQVINHNKLDHPHVIALREIFPANNHLALVLDHAAAGSLRQHLAAAPGGRLPEAEARRMFQQLMLAVHYCHNMGVSSRDIKPDNTLLHPAEDGSNRLDVKLADFGYSRDEDVESLAKTKLGTPAYTSPETLSLGPGARYDSKASLDDPGEYAPSRRYH